MSTSSRMTLSLGDKQLEKLTNDSLEIRMRALDQIETRFIRCLQHEENINFKPVLLLKQLIRWFGFTPPTSTERVLALMLELLRSDYNAAVTRKISLRRLTTELNKIRQIVECLQSERATDTLNSICKLANSLYEEDTPRETTDDAAPEAEPEAAYNHPDMFTIESFKLSPDDFEPAWSRANPDDIATMKIILDSLTVDKDDQIQDNFAHLQIKLRDYPVEYLLQSPYIFLQILHVQQLHAGHSLMQINRLLISTVWLMQNALILRGRIQSYATRIDARDSMPKQLRVTTALRLILDGCLELLTPPLLEECSRNWHVIDVIVEVVRTFGQLAVPAPGHILERLAIIVPSMINFCKKFPCSGINEMASTTKEQMIPRLESLIFNGLMLDVITLSVSTDTCTDNAYARSMLQPLILDSVYKCCSPLRVHELDTLCGLLCKETPVPEQHLMRINNAFDIALRQLMEGKLPPAELLIVQADICLVILHLGSVTLVQQMVDAIIKCTCLYGKKPALRREAESLLLSLFSLPDSKLLKHALDLLKQPVVDHFHSFLNNVNYLPGCSNIKLVTQNILGVPMSTDLLRNLLILAWQPESDILLQQWCFDYLVMAFGLSKLIESKDFTNIYEMILPVMALIVCRSIGQPQVEKLIWQVSDPDNNYLAPTQALRANVCYLFHPDEKLREDAIARITYILVVQDYHEKYKPNMKQVGLDFLAHDISIIHPPIDYYALFNERDNLPFMGNLQTLIRMLESTDLKPSIRRSTLMQLNVVLSNWDTIRGFADCPGSYVLCLQSLHDPLLRGTDTGPMELNSLQPAISILLRVLFSSENFRREFSDNPELLVCLLRSLFLLSHDRQARAEISTCIFQLLFHEHMTPTEDDLILNVDLSAMHIPVSYRVEPFIPETEVLEGLDIQEQLFASHFKKSAAIAAQHWRIFVAQRVCGSPEKFKLSVVHELDVDEKLKLKPSDLALVHASLVQRQLQNQLIEASNCSSHAKMHQIVSSFEMFLVLMRDEMPSAQTNSLWQLIHKYLRLMPGNDADSQLYIALLSLCQNCLRHNLPEVQVGLNKALESDNHHSFMTILRDRHVSINLLQMVSECLVQLLYGQRLPGTVTWHQKLFLELSTLARTHFELRNLQHVRCMLSILRQISAHQLNLEHSKLKNHFQHFVQLSCFLRTSTQTGAQWQRDCLLICCQLQDQMKMETVMVCKGESNSKLLRYFLSLCGHHDAEVRTLAWVSMGSWIKSKGSSMIHILLEFHKHLPGGLAGCCLSTMLDCHEQLLIRELAGRVFELLMPNIGATACTELLMYHAFLQHAHKSLISLYLMPAIIEEDDRTTLRSSCELISCFVSICINQVLMQHSWCDILCDHAFVNGLSDTIKMPIPPKVLSANSYLEMCVDQIFKLYAICYQYNAEFLQRSINRDPVLIECYFTLMRSVLNQPIIPDNQLVQILKLLMIFSKDPNAYEYIIEMIKKYPKLIFELFIHGLNPKFMQLPIQRHTLAAVSLLLIKAQESTDDNNLIAIFEQCIDETQSTDADDNNVECPSGDEDNDENNMNKQLKALSLKSKAIQDMEHKNIIVFLYISLDHLFDFYYPTKTYNFLIPPSKCNVALCEVLGNLLKQSSWSMDASRHFKLLDRIVLLLETFLDDGNVGNATVYVRRVGAHKSRDIINNLLVLLNMLMHWHNAAHSVITDPVMASRIVRVLIRLWPWLSHSIMLKHLTVRLTTMFTEYSFEMCKQTSQVLSSQSHSLLQLMVRVADHETTKKEPSSAKGGFAKGGFAKGGFAKGGFAKVNYDSVIEAALRVMINCCSCAEGRLSLSKMRVLDMFDTIMPASNNTGLIGKVKGDVLLNWVSFWEVFSRYELGQKVCHLHGLINVVRRSPPLCQLRLRCLRVLRNMSFANTNRMQLVNTDEFVDLMRSIVKQPVKDNSGEGDNNIDSYAEHHLAVLSLWKLFGFTAKCRGMLRGSKLFKDLTILSNHLATLSTERSEYFQQFPFAPDLKQVLANLFEAVQS